MKINEQRVIGPPGTGKTTFLSQVLSHRAQQFGSDAVVACSLTHTAANELAGRRVPIARDNIGTLHSFAYQALGRPKCVEDAESIREFNRTVPSGYQLHLGDRGSEMDGDGREGQRLRAKYMLYRSRMVDRQLWDRQVYQFAARWEAFKTSVGGVDFTDMLELALRDCVAHPASPAVIVADEVQDFSKLSMSLLWKWAEAADEIITAGDPDQTIYAFAGADPEVFRRRQPQRQKILEQSYRVPRAIHRIASRWVARCTDREKVTYLPRDEEGTVRREDYYRTDPHSMVNDIQRQLTAGRTCMVIATCGYMLRPTIELLQARAIPYHNPYRPAEVGWNPLRESMETNTAATRLRAYLGPFIGEGQMSHLWYEDEFELWSALMAGVKRRGADILTGDPNREVTVDDLETYFANPEVMGRLLDGGEAGLMTIRRHLAARWQQSGGYACEVARQHGTTALRDEPLLTIGTIHSVKGGEADVVYVFPDLSAASAWEAASTAGENNIRRVFYVAMTRAREELVLCGSIGRNTIDWEDC